MITIEKVISEILRKNGAPVDCPALVGCGDFRKGFDLVGGPKSSTDGRYVTCERITRAKDSRDIHPVCSSCGIVGNNLMEMKKYREMIGLKN